MGGVNGEWNIVANFDRQNDSTSTLWFGSSRSSSPVVANIGATANNPVQLFGPGSPLRRGQWNLVQLHLKASSARGVADGVAQLWVNRIVLMDERNGDFHNATSIPAGALLRRGYLLGWANSGYDQETVFSVDDVKFYNSSPGWGYPL
jgi:hypothetical protein